VTSASSAGDETFRGVRSVRCRRRGTAACLGGWRRMRTWPTARGSAVSGRPPSSLSLWF